MDSSPANPEPTRSGLEARIGRLITPSGVIMAALAVVYLYMVVNAPIDKTQGVIQKILYVHPPQAYLAYLGFLITGVAGVFYLWKGREEFDRLAISGAEVGVIFCTLMLITGPIWARGTWGKWWSWDPRLTVTLLLWFVYLAYLLLRSFSGGGGRAARFASIYGIVGVILIPLNYYIIEIFGGRGMHPENLERGSLGDGMGWPFLMGNLTISFAFLYLLFLRWDVESLRALEAQRDAAAEGHWEGQSDT
jgi:heme exporter protein C